MSTPRSSSVVRTACGLALLAAGASGLAACKSGSSRIPLTATYAPSAAQATEIDGSLPADRALRAHGAHGSGSSGSGTDVAPSGDPIPVDVRRGALGACGCDPRPSCGCDLGPSCDCECLNKSYSVAALDILGYEFLLNQFDRHFISQEEYGSDLDSIIRNLTGGWTFDKDPFRMNQFMHPYGGTIYHGFARSAGLTYWEAFGYDVAASALWEIAGETTPPSINDQITTPIAGSFLGEALFRSANLILEGSCGRPSTATELLAALVSPSTGFNRIAYGGRFDAVYPSHDPAVFSSWSVGMRNFPTLTDTGVETELNTNVAVAAISVDYGLPGKRCYSYDRPFDYFHLEATGTSNEQSIPETVSVRGLLTGRDYSRGSKYCGIWGLYGCYDYFSPQIFKLSSTALSVGTTGQYLASDKFALQGSLLVGMGFTATGTTANERAERSYRYSLSPQALLALRAVYGDRAMLDVTANEYFLADSIESTRSTSSENVVRAQVTLTIRLFGCHAISIGYVQAHRDTSFDGILDPPQSVSSISLSYTHLSDPHFGVVRP